MTRRALLFACAALPLRADDAQQVWDLFTDLAGALSDGKAEEFLSYFDRAMPGYQDLTTAVTALVLEDDINSSIELLSNEGTGTERTVEADWYLHLVGKQDAAPSTQRRERVHCSLAKQGKKWRITALEPLSFFAPPK